MPKVYFKNSKSEFLDYTLTPPPGNKKTRALVIYVHGFVSDQSGEKALFFGKQFNQAGMAYLAFDHRGHGKSSGTMREMTVTRNLDDLDLIMTTVRSDFSKTVLIGSSMGGQTAAWYALRNPDIVTANLLIAPAFQFFQNRKAELGPEGLERIKKDGYYTFKNDWVEVTIGSQLFDDAAKYPMESLIESYRTPTLILHGTEDDSVPVKDSVTFIRLTSARPSELHLISGGDHRLTDNKAALFKAMEAFLAREDTI